MNSPTQRSLAYLRSQGYECAVVERWNSHARIRQDLFGFIDLLALGQGLTLAVQISTASSMSCRRAKILQNQNLPVLMAAGWCVMIHGWYKGPKRQWLVKEEIATDLTGELGFRKF